jgi:protein SCO1
VGCEAALVGIRALRNLACVLAAVALSVAALAPAARADGDPASDVLVGQSLFLPTDSGVSSSQQAQLESFLRGAKRAGFPIRVAVIPDAYDLGSVSVLWLKPQTYARFLGVELALIYKQRLLVVMPNGFGLNWPGHSTTAGSRLLEGVRVGPGGAGLVSGTEQAVRELARAEGITIPASRPPASSTSSGGQTVIVVLAGVLVVLLGAVLAWRVAIRRPTSLRLRIPPRRRRAAPVAATGPPAGAGSPVGTGNDTAALESAWPISPRWAVPGLALVCCVAIGTPILVLSIFRHPRGASGSVTPSSVATPPSSVATPYTWREGQRRAPGFLLADQNGHAVSLAAYRGRPVIVTFIDPLCRNLCPLAAQVLNQVDRQLPAGQRPPIVAVSVDIYADTRPNLLLDFQKWRLVPQWRWAIGAPKRLSAVWDRWQIGVSVATKHIAGTTVHFITHDEVAIIVDGAGFERAAFLWPYTPQDVESELHQLSRS